MFVSEDARNMLIKKRQQKFLIQHMKPMMLEAGKLGIALKALIDTISVLSVSC